jgi:gamma-glutamylcysteine synthetase
MTILWKKKDGPQHQTKLEKRVATIPTSELTLWTETLLYVIGKAIAGSGPKTAEHYIEATANAEALLAVCKELETRTHGL